VSVTEHLIRNITQPKIQGAYKSLPNKSDGIENELRVVKHKGKHYLALKSENSWHFFQEVDIAGV